MIKDNRKDFMAKSNKKIFNSCGMSGIWNQGVGIGGEMGSVAKEVKIVLEQQDIQLWQASRTAAESLGVYVEVKEVWGQEYFFKVGLQGEDIRWVIPIRDSFMPLGERRKYLGRFRSQRGLFFCPMCGEKEDLEHFTCNCKELTELRIESFGIGVNGKN